MVQVKKHSKTVGAIIAAAVLTGCVSGTGIYSPPVEERSANKGVVQSADPATGVQIRPAIVRESRTEKQVSTPVPTPVTVRKQNPAVIALLNSANQLKGRGAMRAAESNLERAQRIAPRDPEIYFQWADVRRLEGQWSQAEQLALKGTNLAIGDVVMLRRLWLLIADIRSSSGDRSGANKARTKALSY